MTTATARTSAFFSSEDAELPKPLRSTVNFYIVADAAWDPGDRTVGIPAGVEVAQITYMHVEMPCIDPERRNDWHEYEITNDDAARALLEAWGIDPDRQDWELDDDGPDGPDPDDQRDALNDW